MVARHPIKLGKGITGNIYAARRYREDSPGIIVTSDREDITAEFRREMNNQLREWVDAGYLEITQSGVPIVNEFFGLGQKKTSTAG